MRQRLLSVCLLFLFLFSSCAIQGEESDFSSLSSSSSSSSESSESSQDLQPSQGSNSESSENPNNEALVSFPFGYDQLTEEEKEVYDLLESNTVTPEQPVILDQSLTVRQANQICNLYQLNRTDYSWQGYQYYAVGTTYVKLLAVPRLDPVFNEQQMTDLFEQRVQWYLEQIPKDATDYEKVVQVATLLCQNVDYYDLAADFSLDTSTLTDPIKRLVQEAKHEYGAIVNGQAICTGYAYAFRYLCGQLGIPVLTVSGYTPPLELHAWNLVYIDGAWYQVDVTWMDKDLYQDNTYLLANDFQLSSDHFNRYYMKAPQGETLLHSFALPSCSSTENSWFVKEGRLFETAEAALEFLKNNIATDSQILQVQLASETEYYRLIHAIPEFLTANPLSGGTFVGFGAQVIESNATARTVTIQSKGIAAG